MRRLTLLTCLVATMTAACGEDEPGNLNVILEAEDSIVNGIAAGSTTGEISDGWSVTFDRYMVTIAEIDVHLVRDETQSVGDTDTHVVDLTQVPAFGTALWSAAGLQAGDWEFFYATSDYQVDGVLSQAGGQSCPPATLATPGGAVSNGNTNLAGDPCYDNPAVAFSFVSAEETDFGPCEVDGMPGFNVPSGGTVTVAATIHGDHLFFNGFPEGGEGGVVRLAQWLADCDLNLDGEVTMTELAAISPSDLVEIDTRYQLGGSPIAPLDNMATYVTAQLKTQGHFQGEGECPADGVGHSH